MWALACQSKLLFSLTFNDFFLSFGELVIFSGDENQVNDFVQLFEGGVDGSQRLVFDERVDEGGSERVHVADRRGREVDLVQRHGGRFQAVTDCRLPEF